MLNSLKRLDKKFLIIIGLIICIPIFIIVFLAIIQGCGNSKISYEKYEEKMISALENYVEDKDKIPTEEGDLVKIKLDALVKGGYIKSTDKLLDDSTCDGYVTVRRNGSSIESNEGGFLNYTVNLECDDYATIHLVDKIKENVVSADSGLYQVGDSFVFKGSKVNNYISFYGNNYRILSIDKDGVLKLVKSQSESTNRKWDNKFNIETNRNSGINIYKDSLMLDYLLYDYENSKKFSNDAKKNVVAYDVCVGKRGLNDYSIDSTKDCSTVLDNQILSLLNVSDYAMASLDVNCLDLKSRSCNNYNYLYGIASSTWTLNSVNENTYQIIAVSDGVMEVFDANQTNSYNIVIYVDGNMIYTSGSGTEDNPYIIQ